jgi:V8-like Glu-specific endopeptidase
MVKRMLSACASIGCVSSRNGARLGTGFLVDGASVGAGGPGGPVFVTNAHVLSDTVQGAVPLLDALVSFELMPLADGKPGFYEVDQLLFTSPPGALGHCCEQTQNLDVSVVSLKQLPPTLAGLSVSQNLPLINGQTKAYVIGHPRGSGLQISVHDSVLLAADEERRLLHYRTPTDPGSSGSPVFNDQWKVIALHHGGSDTTPRLKPASGVYEANEGVTLAAIRSGIGQRRPDSPAGPAAG